MIANGLGASLGGIDFSQLGSKYAKTISSALGNVDFHKLMSNNFQLPPTTPAKSPKNMTIGVSPNLDAGVNDMLFLQSLNNGANLIGKTITYEKAGSSIPAKGKVEGVEVNDGKIYLLVGGNLVPLSQVRGIVAHAP